jgi:hypothetical protein
LAQRCGVNYEPYQPYHHPFKDQISEKAKLKMHFNANEINIKNPDMDIEVEFKISAGKLTGAYKNLTKEQLQTYHLARVKGEKISSLYETGFIVLSLGATYASSYFTQQSTLSNIDPTRIAAENLGETATTKTLNSVLVTFVKQTGKKIPPVVRYGVGIPLAIGATVGQGYLLATGKLPFLFAGPLSTPIIAIAGMQCKKWVQGKPYGTTKGYITKDWPTEEDFDTVKAKVADSFVNSYSLISDKTQEETENRVTEIDDELKAVVVI